MSFLDVNFGKNKLMLKITLLLLPLQGGNTSLLLSETVKPPTEHFILDDFSKLKQILDILKVTKHKFITKFYFIIVLYFMLKC